jgi:hypothetical protein
MKGKAQRHFEPLFLHLSDETILVIDLISGWLAPFVATL